MNKIVVKAAETLCRECGNNDPNSFATLIEFGFNKHPKRADKVLGAMCLKCGTKEEFGDEV
jgi:hypothetical protein